MPHYDCQLDHHAEIRVEAPDPTEAKAEYFRLYAIKDSTAAWGCKEVKADEQGELPPAPVEPERWIERRKQLGTFEPVKAATKEPAADSPLADLPPTKAEEAQAAQASQATT